MQCFQKDPNLRVSARKLLKHAWIVGSRRSDAPVAKPPANFNEAVEEVKQWNEALRSPTAASFRAGTRPSGGSPLPSRRDLALRSAYNSSQPLAKGPLSLATSRNQTEAFRYPESPTDDNWDDDFASSISPSALQLPHLKPHDNFGGLLSADRLKAFASLETANDQSENWDDNFEGDLMTIVAPRRQMEIESSDLETIRPYRAKPQEDNAAKPAAIPSGRKMSNSGAPRQKSPTKPHGQSQSKFKLPQIPTQLYREQSVEDYSDLFVDNDNVFDRRLNIVKVRICIP